MKILSILSLVLSLALLGGIAFLVLEMTDLGERIDELEANRSKDTRELSNDISTAFTRIGELDAEVRGLWKRTDEAATKKLGASVEEIIETKLAEREARRREERARQRTDRRARGEERELNELTEALQLNDATKKKMKAILAQSPKDIREFFVKLRNEGDFDQEKIREGMQKINTTTDEAAKKILSEEQFKKYQEIQTRNRQRWGNMGDGRR